MEVAEKYNVRKVIESGFKRRVFWNDVELAKNHPLFRVHSEQDLYEPSLFDSNIPKEVHYGLDLFITYVVIASAIYLHVTKVDRSSKWHTVFGLFSLGLPAIFNFFKGTFEFFLTIDEPFWDSLEWNVASLEVLGMVALIVGSLNAHYSKPLNIPLTLITYMCGGICVYLIQESEDLFLGIITQLFLLLFLFLYSVTELPSARWALFGIPLYAFALIVGTEFRLQLFEVGIEEHLILNNLAHSALAISLFMFAKVAFAGDNYKKKRYFKQKRVLKEI